MQIKLNFGKLMGEHYKYTMQLALFTQDHPGFNSVFECDQLKKLTFEELDNLMKALEASFASCASKLLKELENKDKI